MPYTSEQWAALEKPAQDRYVRRLQADFRFFCKEILRIRPKDPDLNMSNETTPTISFQWNEAQEIAWEAMVKQMSQGLPIDIIILKARQLGISTFFLAFLYWMMWRSTNVNCAVYAHRKEPTLTELSQTMQTFYAEMPDGLRPLNRSGRTDKMSNDETFFSDRRGRCVFVKQAEEASRGITGDYNLCTEVAYYKAALEFFNSFGATRRRGKNSMLVLESTARDGFFKDEYFRAKRGEAGHRLAIFIAWWRVPSLYSDPIDWRGRKPTKRFHGFDPHSGARIYFDDSETAEKVALDRLAKKEGLPPLTWEQMYWRQNTIANKSNGNLDQFNQEYPRDEESAFMYQTRSAFKSCLPIAQATSEEKVEEIIMGSVVSPDVNYQTRVAVYEPRIAFRQEAYPGAVDQEMNCGLMLIDPPRKGYTYAIGADVAGEVSDPEMASERAASVACVYCLETREQVAEWRGHIDPHDFGTELVMLGWWYNQALLCVERNNMGITTEDRIVRYLQYPNCYKWPDWNAGLDSKTKKNMWETNPRTKNIMITTFKKWVDDRMWIVRSPRLYSEMGSYVTKGDKGFTTTDKPSDTIIAGSLSVMAAIQIGTEKVLASPVAVPQSAYGAAARFRIGADEAAKNGDDEQYRVIPRNLPQEFDRMGLDNLEIDDIWGAAGI